MNSAILYAMSRLACPDWDDPPGFWTWILAREVARAFGNGCAHPDDEGRRLVRRWCPYRWSG